MMISFARGNSPPWLCHDNLYVTARSLPLRLPLSSGRGSPCLQRLISEGAGSSVGNEMTLGIEGVVDGGVNGHKALSWSRWFESLHFSFASPNSLMRILNAIVPTSACS
jgi:hypothetical protein